MRLPKWLWASALGVGLLCASTAEAVILYGEAGRNTEAPTGSLAESGWQWQGQFGSFLGTPIAPNYFITSGHVGGEPGQPFIYNGQIYTTSAYFDDPNSDLRIWKIEGKGFDSYAPLFKNGSEVGRSAVLFGRGTQRGEPVYQDGELKGWQWGFSDGLQSWGRNTLDGITDGGPQRGDLLTIHFDQNGNSDEGILSAGDSGGGVFVRHGSRWKLAGINTSVDGPYSYLDGQTSFNAALFDKGGMHVLNASGSTRIDDIATDIPAAAYITRISANLVWINGVLSGQIKPGAALADNPNNGIPEPTGALITLTTLGAMTLMRLRFSRRRHP